MTKKTAVIIGAGPAGLTAAYELLDKTDILPVIFEASGDYGGIAKTVCYRGNRIDIGGHRFFSKSDRVVQWWTNILPLQGAPSRDDLVLHRDVSLSGHAQVRALGERQACVSPAPDPEHDDLVMLIRRRLSRIYFLRKFFDYPITLKSRTLINLGVARTARIISSYLKSRLRPVHPEKNLEDFFINRFGRELYDSFFRSYTEKVWGVPCAMINPEWGAQRIKGVSVSKAILHAARRMVGKSGDTSREVETSLIGEFMYPKFGPGQMWEAVAERIRKYGGEIHMNHRAIGMVLSGGRLSQVRVQNNEDGSIREIKADYVFSTMPVKNT